MLVAAGDEPGDPVVRGREQHTVSVVRGLGISPFPVTHGVREPGLLQLLVLGLGDTRPGSGLDVMRPEFCS